MAGRSLTLTAKLLADSSAFNRGMGSAAKATGEFSSATGKIGDRLKKLALPLAAIGIGAVAAGAKFVGLAAEAEQNLGGAEAVFGSYANEIKQKGSEAYKTLGLSQSDYLSTANKMGSLFQGSGISQQKSLTMTSDAMQRAADVASVMGIDVGSAMESVTGAAKGNFTMMDNLGVAMNATSIEAYAVSKGMTGFSYATATTAEKTSVAMEMFMDKTSQYAGTFSKELTTLSGVQDMLKAKFENFGVSIGNKLLPVLTALATGLSVVMDWAENKLMPAIGKLGQAFIGPLKEAFSGAGIDAGALGKAIGDTILKSIEKLTEIVDVVLPKLIAFGQWAADNVDVWGPIAAAIGGIVLAVQTITIATELWAVAQAAFNVIMSLNPIMIVVLAVAALTAAIIYVATQTTFFQELWANVTSFMSKAWGAVTKFVLDKWNGAVAGINKGLSSVKAFFTTIFTAVGVYVAKIILDVQRNFTNGFNSIKSHINIVIAAAKLIIAAIKITVSQTVESVKSFFSNGFIWVKNIIQGHINNIRTTIQIVQVVTGIVVAAVKVAFSNAFNWVVGIVQGHINNVRNAISWVTGTAQSVASGVGNAFAGAFNWVLSVVQNVIAGVQATVGWVANTASNVANTVRDVLVTAFNTVSSVVTPIIDGVSSAFGRISGAVQTTISWVSNLFNSFSPPAWLSKILGGGATGFSVQGGFDMTGLSTGSGATGSILSLGRGNGGSAPAPNITYVNIEVKADATTDKVALGREISNALKVYNKTVTA